MFMHAPRPTVIERGRGLDLYVRKLLTTSDWHAGPTLHVRQGRVAVTGGSVVDDPKSQRSRRDMPLPA
jgi:hypothetical protein